MDAVQRDEFHALMDDWSAAIIANDADAIGCFAGGRFANDEWATEVFVRRGDAWKCNLTHLTTVADKAMDMDGVR